jgi:hypothetical protein
MFGGGVVGGGGAGVARDRVDVSLGSPFRPSTIEALMVVPVGPGANTTLPATAP